MADNINGNDNGERIEYDPRRDVEHYPNLFEQMCDEDDRLMKMKRAIHYVREALAEYPEGTSHLGSQQYERAHITDALDSLTAATRRRRGNIGVTLAASYTRNPDYDHYAESSNNLSDTFIKSERFDTGDLYGSDLRGDHHE